MKMGSLFSKNLWSARSALSFNPDIYIYQLAPAAQ